MVYLVGYIFKPDNIFEMYVEDLKFWMEGIDVVAKFTGAI